MPTRRALDLITLEFPKGEQPSKLVKAGFVTADQDEINRRRILQNERLGRDYVVATTWGRSGDEVYHTGASVEQVRGMTLDFSSILSLMDLCGRRPWARFVKKPDGCYKLQIFYRELRPGTKVVPQDVLEEYLGRMKKAVLRVEGLWINPDQNAEGREFMNLVLCGKSEPEKANFPDAGALDISYEEEWDQLKLETCFRPKPKGFGEKKGIEEAKDDVSQAVAEKVTSKPPAQTKPPRPYYRKGSDK